MVASNENQDCRYHPGGIILPCLTGLVIGLIPSVAWPDNAPTDTLIGATYCAVVSWMTGNLGIGLAIAAVTILGSLAMLGRINWGLASLAGAGIAIIFGAGAILVALNAGAPSSCPGSSSSSSGGLEGDSSLDVPPSPYINLTTTGILAPAQLYPTEYSWITLMWISNQLNSPYPINGWLQIVVTGLPPGMSAVLASDQPGGVDANGNPFIMEGFFNVSANLQQPWWVTTNVTLTQNGQPLPPGTPLPSSINVQYKLYNSFSDYSAGCTVDCALTSQYKYTIPTTEAPAPCTAGTCIALPL